MHEVVFSDDRQAKAGVRTGDIAKRLIDYGFHPYTVSFPLIVHGALMIEPTETESKLELDQFIEAMIAIAQEVESDPQMVKNAPYGTRTSRVDEVGAARKPVIAMEAGLEWGRARSRRPRERSMPSGAICCGCLYLLFFCMCRSCGSPSRAMRSRISDIARHVFEQPLTPQNFQYVFSGRLVDAAGHPHPPLDAYLVALAWMLRGHVSVLFFHVFYLIFALGISFAAYALAARFTIRPLWAALLVAACPLVQANTNTLAGPESPGLCFLLAGAAAFFWRRFLLSGVALTLAGLTELQALALAPILLVEYLVRRERPPRSALLALAAPYAGLAGWQATQWALCTGFRARCCSIMPTPPDGSAKNWVARRPWSNTLEYW